MVAFAAMLPLRLTAQITTTTVQGAVYRADGTPASGAADELARLHYAADQAIAAGNTSATIGADGFVSVNLTPNAGSLPNGNYYTAVYHLSDGTVTPEYWVVPSSGSAAIASVRAQLQPSTMAVQPVSQAYVKAPSPHSTDRGCPGRRHAERAAHAEHGSHCRGQAVPNTTRISWRGAVPAGRGTLSGPLTVPNLYAKQFEGRLYADQQQSGAGSNNGIAMSLTDCLTYNYACEVLAPALYAQTKLCPGAGSRLRYCSTTSRGRRPPTRWVV